MLERCSFFCQSLKNVQESEYEMQGKHFGMTRLRAFEASPRSDQPVVKRDGTFRRGGWEELTKLMVNVVKLSLHYKFVAKFRKFAPYKGRRQTGRG